MERNCLESFHPRPRILNNRQPIYMSQRPLPPSVSCTQQAPSGGGEPSRVQCCYERAISVFPVTTELWMQYGECAEMWENLMPDERVHSTSWRGKLCES